MKEIINKLYYWHTIEMFSEFKVEIDRKKSYCNVLPWLNEDKYKHYEVCLGIYKNCNLIDFIIKKYGDKEGAPEPISGLSCLCVFKVNEEGEYIEDSLKFSTLPYAVNQLLFEAIKSTNTFNNFNDFQESIEGIAINKLKKVNYTTINEFLNEILKNFKWFDETWLSTKAKFKVEEREIKEDNNEEVDTYLNSFYLKDIENLIYQVKNHNYGKAFRDFIKQDDKVGKVDIENDRKHIEHILEPKNIPMGKWPSKYGLSLMQQVAVNLALEELNDNGGVFSVNGPPGTGKTTLLRDVISNIVIDRAKNLSNYANPKEAFTKSSNYIKVITKKGSELKFYPYLLSESLKGYGITVVSNNNNAVENISKELPEINAIEGFEEYIEADYFRNISDKVFGIETWGMISAKLGKKKNCSKFVNDFWWSGFYKIYQNSDEIESVLDWDEEKNKFLEKYTEVEEYKKGLNELKEVLENEESVKREINKLNGFIVKFRNSIEENEQERENIELLIIRKKEKRNILNEIIKCHKSKKPSFFVRILNRKRYKEYISELGNHNLDKKKILEELFDFQNKIDSIIDKIRNLKSKKHELNEKLDKENKELDRIIKIKDKWMKCVGERYPKKYWNESIDEQQLNCLWTTDELNKKRCELFLLSLQLHKAFILNAGETIKSNLSLLMNYLSGNEIQGDYLKYMSDLWNTLFLVVPVISSPFASIARMYRNLGKEEIGWLLIDEAGQALPQTALGAIWRSKRVVVVGDPLQVEPVSTVPLSLIEVIGKAWNVEDIVSKTLSVQGMADKINKYGTKREELWIGCPLRVHRRCENPMFNISNKIAYDNKMIYGTIKKDKKLPIEKSIWIDCKGKSIGDKSHYVPEQGEIIYEMVKKCIVDNILPSLYVISPFTTVANGLKAKISKLNSELQFIDSKLLEEWIKKSIGTVHTFQGKEAEIVIICLGVDNDHEGAVRWASKSPNILNVAVTRAKKRVVIVGDKKLWGSEPYFKEALKFLDYIE